MRFLLLTMTIMSIIGSVWYNNKLETQQESESESLAAEYEKAEEKVLKLTDKLDREINEISNAINLEEDIYQKKISALQKEREREAQINQQNAERSLRRKKAALEAAIAKRKLTAEEWKTTLATFKTRRAEIAKLLKEHREQIASNNQKLADKISEDRNNIAKREDEMRRQASDRLAWGKAGGRGTSYAIIEAKEAMIKKHRSLTRAVNLQNQKLMESISNMENELVQMDRAEEAFMDKNSPHNKPINANLDDSKEFVAEIDEADPELKKLADSHKKTLEELQNSFDEVEEKKAKLIRNWEKERQGFSKAKTELIKKHHSAKNNAAIYRICYHRSLCFTIFSFFLLFKQIRIINKLSSIFKMAVTYRNRHFCTYLICCFSSVAGW